MFIVPLSLKNIGGRLPEAFGAGSGISEDAALHLRREAAEALQKKMAEFFEVLPGGSAPLCELDPAKGDILLNLNKNYKVDPRSFDPYSRPVYRIEIAVDRKDGAVAYTLWHSVTRDGPFQELDQAELPILLHNIAMRAKEAYPEAMQEIYEFFGISRPDPGGVNFTFFRPPV